MDKEILISFRDFTFQYEDQNKPALEAITLDIYRGEVLLIIGSSGCGKSSLCMAMNGAIPHLLKGEMSGSVDVMEHDLQKASPSVLARHVGMVFQDPEIQLFATSVEDEVAMSLESLAVPRKEMRTRVDLALNEVGLTGLETRAPSQLSGGQKQRVALASVLAREPDVLVLDEPTGNLDPIGTRSVMETVRRICDSDGRTVVLVEKDLGPVVHLVDRVALMDDGRIRYVGSPQDLLRRVDLLKECGLRISAATQIAVTLEQKGITKFDSLPTTADELAEELRNKQFTLKPTGQIGKVPLPTNTESGKAATPVVDFDEVVYRYRNGFKGLDNVSFKVRQGEFVAILGHNGAGKSTLVQHIIGILRPTSGTVFLQQKDIRDLSVAELARHVGFIFQNPNHQIFNSTVKQEITFGPRNLGWSPERIETAFQEVVQMCDLLGLDERNPEDLSIGEKQRVAVASILVMDPDVLILDEPTTGQDERSLGPIMAIVDKLHQSGKTIIMISHDMELAARHVERVLMIERGQVVFDGSPADAFTDFDLLERMRLEPPETVRISRLLADGPPPFLRFPQDLVELVQVPGGVRG